LHALLLDGIFLALLQGKRMEMLGYFFMVPAFTYWKRRKDVFM
jgi:hypothetical protein